MSTKEAIDWEYVQTEYRFGSLTIRALAAEVGVSEGAVRQRAKVNGWVRKERATVRRMIVDRANEVILPHITEPDPARVAAIAQRGADVLVRHRETASIMAGLLTKLVSQLNDATDEEKEFSSALEEYFELKAASNPLMAAVYRKQCTDALAAISLGSRSKAMLALVSSADKLVGIERKSWSLDDDSDKRSYEDLLAEVHQKTMETRNERQQP